MRSVFKIIVVFIITTLARAVLRKYKPRVIAVTGSVGKTATKDAIGAVVSEKQYVWTSKKSFNGDIGVPLTILGCENAWGKFWGWLSVFAEGFFLLLFRNRYPDTIVVEIGTDRPGDIARITSWLKPDAAVITAFPEVPVHIEFFSSREALIEEKKHVIRALKPDGFLVLNADDKDVFSLRSIFPHRVISYGVSEAADVSLAESHIEYDERGRPWGMGGRIAYKENVLPLRIRGILGSHLLYAPLAGMAVGIEMGIDAVTALQGLQNFSPPPGRSRILNGIYESIIIDDSYNSSPAAIHASLNALSSVLVPGRKIAVLGDMLELGKWSGEEHKKVGARIPSVVSLLLTVGMRVRILEEAAQAAGMKEEHVLHFDDAESAGKFLEDRLGPGDIVLIKGSQSMRMERAVAHLLRDKNDSRLLARQEKEWQERK